MQHEVLTMKDLMLLRYISYYEGEKGDFLNHVLCITGSYDNPAKLFVFFYIAF